MQTAPYLLLQDRLSTIGSFIICDSNARGFPMLYASQGFVDLFGYTAAECRGKSCGSLIAAPSIYHHDPELRGLASVSGMTSQRVAEGLDILTESTRKEVDLMMESRGGYVAYVQVVNRKNDGEVFVCEVIMLVYTHPTLGWKFAVGLQTDISDEVSIKDLLTSALTGEHLVLRKSRREIVNQQLARMDVGSDAIGEYLYEKASEVWLYYFNDLLGRQRSDASMEPDEPTESTADSEVVENQNNDDLWRHGKLIQDYDQSIDFFADRPSASGTSSSAIARAVATT